MMTPQALLVLGDSCTGTDTPHEGNFARVVARIQGERATRTIATGLFLGDQVMGYCDADTLRQQWAKFHAGPLAALASTLPHLRHIASNHVHYDEASAAVYAENCGAPEWEAVIDGVQYLAINTASIERGGDAMIDVGRLEGRLHLLRRDLPIVVLGHHPIWSVNGYARTPLWVVPPDEGQAAWALFRQYGVTLYLCSHIIAFDVQLHDGLAQVCTGGAGTEYGPGSAMPGQCESPHAVLIEGLGSDALRIDRIAADDDPDETWHLARFADGWRHANRTFVPLAADETVVGASGYAFNISRTIGASGTFSMGRQIEGPPICAVRHDDTGLHLSLTPRAGESPLHWSHPTTEPWHMAHIEVHTGAGPGGVLLQVDGAPFSSMHSLNACGLEEVRAPDQLLQEGDGTVVAAYIARPTSSIGSSR